MVLLLLCSQEIVKCSCTRGNKLWKKGANADQAGSWSYLSPKVLLALATCAALCSWQEKQSLKFFIVHCT